MKNDFKSTFTSLFFTRQFEQVNIKKFYRTFFSWCRGLLIKLPKIEREAAVIWVCIFQIWKFSKLLFPFFPRHNSGQCRGCNRIVNWNNRIMKMQILRYERAWNMSVSSAFFNDLKQFPVSFDNGFQLIFSERLADGFQFFKYLVHAGTISPNAISKLFHRIALRVLSVFDLSFNASRVSAPDDPKFGICSGAVFVIRKSLAQIVKNFVGSFP